MRRLAVVFGVVVAAGVGPTQVAVPQSAPASPLQVPALRGDFNGDGFADPAVGVPGEDVGAVRDAGAVNVLYDTVGSGNWSGAGSQLFTQSGAGGSAGAGDRFGGVVAAGNFNGDGFGDLAVGAAGEDVGSVVDAGAVNVLYGSATGLTGLGAQQFTQDSPNVGSATEPDDRFGAALAAGDFDGDGFADLAVGVPGEIGVVRAGAVTVLYGTAGGLTGTGSQLLTQNSPGVRGDSETGDRFGQALAAGDFDGNGFFELAVGAAGEDVSAVVDAGAVTVLAGSAGGLTGTGSQLFTQDTPGVGGGAERGDGFGFALAAGACTDPFGCRPGGLPYDLAIGAPREDVYSRTNAGAVTRLFGSAGGLSGAGSQTYTQNNIGPGSSAEAGDLFGYALAMGDFNPVLSGDTEYPTDADIAIGVPGEDVFGVVDAGLLNVVYGIYVDLPNPRPLRITQFGGSGPERGDRFGFAVTASGENIVGQPSGVFVTYVVVGAPGEDVDTAAGTVADAGALNFLIGTDDFADEGGGGLRGVGGVLTQNSPGVLSSAEPGDLFSNALATSGL